MAEFLNSYHFVPTIEGAGDKPEQGALPIEHARSETFGFDDDTAGDGHAIYKEDTFSGRIVCTLTTKTPIVVGSQIIPGDQQNRTAARISQFHLPNARGIDAPAIPATSLKGMISSIVEAASGSALRVLDDRPVSYRKKAEDALHAIGRLKKREGKWTLEPLTIPLLEAPNGAWQVKNGNTDIWTQALGSKVAAARYVGTYSAREQRQIQIDGNLQNLPVQPQFANRFEEDGLGNRFVYARMNPFVQIEDENGKLVEASSFEALISALNAGKAPHRGNTLFLDVSAPLDQGDISPTKLDDSYVRGYLRTIFITERVGQLPDTREHEIFIPFPYSSEEAAEFRLNVSDDAIYKFKQLAYERWLASEGEGQQTRLPYSLIDIVDGAAQPWFAGNHPSEDFSQWDLRDGLLVYFDLNRRLQVSEISISAIWRNGPIEGRRIATNRDFFRKAAIDERGGVKQSAELLPMSGARSTISVAERMFGFVPLDDEPQRRQSPDAIRAVAGRIRFSNAVCISNEDSPNALFLEEVLLKELASPKPPSPALYFRKAGGGGVKKTPTDLKTGEALPQGRKFYLHQNYDESRPDTAPWRTRLDAGRHDGIHRKARATPVKTNTAFTFFVDFDNLSPDELALLCFALRPSQAFWHKIGHGKSIGLGSVQIDPIAFLQVDRRCRYKVADCKQKLRFIVHGDFDKLPKNERMRSTKDGSKSKLTPASLAQSARSTWQEEFPQAMKALLEIGEFHSQRLNDTIIPSPLTDQQFPTRSEGKTYEWFVNNSRPSEEYQTLKPITEGVGLRSTKLNTNVSPPQRLPRRQ